MSQPLRFFRSSIAVAALASITAFAADFPAKPVRLITPFPPGGSVDLVARLLGADLAKAWAQQVVVDNRAGASGNIGTELAKNAAPDGYALLVNTLPFVTNQFAYSKVPYDPVADFAPVSLLSSVASVLVSHPALPVNSMKDLVALARARPGQLNYPSAGVGSSSHLAGELLAILTGIRIVHIPYKGGGPAMIDTISGEMHMMFATMPAAMPHVKSERVRPVAVTTARRSQTLPALPTIAETGIKGYEASTWYGVLAPAKTPRAVVERLHGEIVKMLAAPEIRERLGAQGFEPAGNTPEEFATYTKSEIAKWGKVIRAAGIKAE